MSSVYTTVRYLILSCACILWSASHAQASSDCFAYTIPRDPENLRIGNIFSNAVTLHWVLPFVDVPRTENFEITVSPAPQHGSCTGICTIPNNRTTCADGDNCRMTVDSLQPGISYVFSLRSLNCRGVSRSIGPVQATVSGEITTSVLAPYGMLAPTTRNRHVHLSTAQSVNIISTKVASLPMQTTPVLTPFEMISSTTRNRIHSPVTHSAGNISTRLKSLLTATVTATILKPANQDLQLTVQWIITGVIVPVSIICTALLSALFFWLFVRKHMKRQQETHLEARNTNLKCPNCDEQTDKTIALEVTDNLDSKSSRRKSEHVYSVPRWSTSSDFSMLYNEAYQSDFSVTINTAYSHTGIQAMTEN